MSTNLSLPYLSPGQAQKHVTVNESLRRLDAIVQMSAASSATSAQPPAPDDGSIYILPAGKSGDAWSSMAEGALAYYRDGTWEEITPREGWLAFVRDANFLLHYTGAAWSRFAPAEIIAVSAADRLIGRVSVGAGPAEEIALTAAGRALLDDASASAQRMTLGLGTAATRDTGASGATVPLLSGANQWSSTQEMQGGLFLTQIAPVMYFNDLDASPGPDTALSRILTTSGEFRIGFLKSDFSLEKLALTIGRSAETPTSAAFGCLVRPSVDNAYSCGATSYRWSVVYAATGSISTSDAREKTALRPLQAAERRAIRRVIEAVGVYQWLDAMAAKGGDHARLHVGVTAQAVAQAFAAEGLDAARYGLFCADAGMEGVQMDGRKEERPADGPSDEPIVRLGIRYDQLFAMALATLIQAA